MTNDEIQESPICQLGMMYTEAILFRKVRLIFYYCPFCLFGSLPLIIWFKRIYNNSQCMVSRLVCSIADTLNVYLRKFQGNPSRPRDIPRPRGIQAGAFSQRRREHPRRSNTLFGIWRRQENLCWTSLC